VELYLHSPNMPFMAWCLVKAQGQFYIHTWNYCGHGNKHSGPIKGS